MRGFAALLVAGAFAITAMHSLALQSTVYIGGSGQLEASLKIAALRAVEDDLQTSLQMVLLKAGSKESEPKQRAGKIILALAKWEKIVEQKYARQGVQVDAWLTPLLLEQEKVNLPIKMLEQKRVLKCAGCIDFSLVETLSENNPDSFAPKEREFASTLAALLASSAAQNITFSQVGAGWGIYLQNEGIASVGGLK